MLTSRSWGTSAQLALNTLQLWMHNTGDVKHDPTQKGVSHESTGQHHMQDFHYDSLPRDLAEWTLMVAMHCVCLHNADHLRIGLGLIWRVQRVQHKAGGLQNVRMESSQAPTILERGREIQGLWNMSKLRMRFATHVILSFSACSGKRVTNKARADGSL